MEMLQGQYWNYNIGVMRDFLTWTKGRDGCNVEPFRPRKFGAEKVGAGTSGNPSAYVHVALAEMTIYPTMKYFWKRIDSRIANQLFRDYIS